MTWSRKTLLLFFRSLCHDVGLPANRQRVRRSAYGQHRAAAIQRLEERILLSGVQQTLIDFENLSDLGTISAIQSGDQSYSSDSYRISGSFSVFGHDSPSSYTGSAAAAFGHPSGTLSRVDGKTFSLRSLDLSTLKVDQQPATLIFTGRKADGTQVTQGATADGLALRRQSFVAFDNLISVAWLGVAGSGGAQIDNIALESVWPDAVSPAPVVADHQFSVQENSIAGTVVGQVTVANARSMEIIRGNSSGAFAINESGLLRIANSAAIDFEQNPRFELVIRASSSQYYFQNGYWDTAVITVNVQDVLNDRFILPPAVDGHRTGTAIVTDEGLIPVVGSTVGLMEFSLAGLNRLEIQDSSLSVYVDPSGDLNPFRVYSYAGDGILSASDPPGGGGTLVATFTPREYGWNQISLSRSAMSTVIRTATQGHLGFSLVAGGSIDPKIRASEHPTDGPRLSLGIRANSAPIVTESVFTIAENGSQLTGSNQLTVIDPDSADTHTWSLVSSTLPNAFRVEPDGRILVNQAALLNYEAVRQVRLTVRATDSGLAPLSDTGVITINLTDVDEKPVVQDQTITFTGRLSAGLAIGRVQASDPERLPLSYQYTFSSAGFTVDSAGYVRWTSAALSAGAGSQLPSSSYVYVSVRDAGGQLSTARVTVLVTQRHVAPTILPLSPVRIPENSANGTVIGTVRATDPDPGTILKYSITNSSVPFRINSTTGQITVGNSSQLNYETWSWQNAFGMTVYVGVSNGVFRVQVPVQIHLTDVNEAPILNDATVTVDEFSPQGTAVLGLVATDPDVPRQQLTYSIVSGNARGAFAIDTVSGVITVSQPARLNASVQASHRLVVRVTDSATPALTDTAAITVNVAMPKEFSVRQYAEPGTLVGMVRTDSVPASGRTYTIISGNEGDAFAVSAQGILSVARPDTIRFFEKPQYSLIIRVTSGGVSQNITQIVNVRIDHPRWLSLAADAWGESRTGPDANGIRRWQQPTQPLVQTVQGGNGQQSRVAMRFSFWSLGQLSDITLSIRVTSTRKNELSDELIPIDVYAVPRRYTEATMLPVDNFSDGRRVGRLVLRAGDLSENRTHLIQLDETAIRNFWDIYGDTSYLTLSLRNDTNANAVTIVPTNDTSAAEAGRPQLHGVRPGPESSDAIYVENGSTPSSRPFVRRLIWQGYDYGSTQRNLGADRYWTAGQSNQLLKILGLQSDGRWLSAYTYGDDTIFRYESSFTMPVPIIPETMVGLSDSEGGGAFAARDATGNWWLARDAYFSYAEKWHIAGHWSPDVNWSDIQVADFDGNGMDDIAGRDPVTGRWTVSRSVWGQFSASNPKHSLSTALWGSWPATADWKNIVAADFTGDNRADLLAQSSTGEWWLSRSTGAGFAPAVQFGQWDAADPVIEVLAGDVNGDFRDDLIGRTSSGTWLLGAATATGLDTRVLGHWSGGDGWDQSVVLRNLNWMGYDSVVVASRNKRTNEIWVIDPNRNGLTAIFDIGAIGGADMQRIGSDPVAGPVNPVSVPAPRGQRLNPVRPPESPFVETPPTPGDPVAIPANSSPAGISGTVTRQLVPPSFRSADYVYSSVVSSGGTLVADNDVFVRVGTSWVYQATLSPSSPDRVEITSLAISGNTVAIGNSARAEVYLFERTGTVWKQTTLLRDDSELGGQAGYGYFGFGGGVVLEKDTLVVYDPARERLVVYQRNPGGWQRQSELPLTGSIFLGTKGLTLSGDRIVAAVSTENSTFKAVVFEKTQGFWRQTAAIIPQAGFQSDRSISLSGETLAITGSGRAAIYEHTAAGWRLTQTSAPGSNLSVWSMHLAGNRMVTSASRAGVGQVTQLYQRTGAGWVLLQEWAKVAPVSFDSRDLVLRSTDYYASRQLTLVTLAAPVRPVMAAKVFTIPERLSAGQTVGTMVVTQVPASGPTEYSILSGNTADAFRIDSVTGRITVKRPERLDFETSRTIVLRIQARRDGLTAVGTATIQLQDVVEPETLTIDDGDPEFSLTSLSSVTGGFGGDARLLPAGSGTGKATWKFQNLTSGYYRILATWSGGSQRSSTATYTFRDRQVIAGTATVSQRIGSSGRTIGTTRWQILGNVWVSRGELNVEMASQTDGAVFADAVMVEWISARPLVPNLAVTASGSSLSSGATVNFGTTNFGEPAWQTVILQNTGTEDLILQPLSTPAGFSVVQNLNVNHRLGPGDSVSITLEFSGSEQDSRNGELKILSNDPDSPIFRVNLSALRPSVLLGEAVILVDGAEVKRGSGIIDFGNVDFVSGVPVTKTVTIFNRGTTPLALRVPQVSYEYEFPSGAAFATGNLSHTIVAPGETATFTVSVVASASGVHLHRITVPVSGYRSDGSVFFMVRAVVRTPEIDIRQNGLSASYLTDFGITGRNGVMERSFLIRNVGDLPLVLQPASVTGDFEIVNNVSPGQAIQPGGEYSLNVRFKATVPGQTTGELIIRSNDSDESVWRHSLLATVGVPAISVYSSINGGWIANGGRFDWGQQSPGSTFTTRTLRIRNNGNYELILQPITLPAGFSIEGANLTPGQRLAPNSYVDVTIRLDRSVPGRRAGEVLIGSNDSNDSSFKFWMQADVGPVTDVDVTVDGTNIARNSMLNFGQLTYGTTVTKTFTVTNRGNVPLTVQPISVPAGFSVVGNLTADQVLPAGASATFSVVYEAVARTPTSGSLVLRTNDPDEGAFIVQLSAATKTNGVPVLTFEDAPFPSGSVLDFGSMGFGTSAVRTLVLSNPGSEAVLINSVSGNSHLSLLNPALPLFLPPGASTELSLQLKAISIGNSTAGIYLNGPTGTIFSINTRVSVLTGGEIGVTVDGKPVASQATFSSAPIQLGTTVTRIVSVRNTSTTPLRLMPATTSASYGVTITLQTNFTSGQVVAPGRTASVRVQISADREGIFPWSLSILSSDSDETSYVVRFQEVVLADAPEIEVRSEGTALIDNLAALDFGATYIGRPVVRTFSVANAGFQDLIVQPMIVPSGFTVLQNFTVNQVIMPGQSVEVSIRMEAAELASRSGQAVFLTNDSSETPFDFRVSGNVIDPPPGWQLTEDDASSGFSRIGSWTRQSTGSFGSTQFYSAAGTGSDKAVWKFSDLLSGRYEVLTTWKNVGTQATNAVYRLTDTGSLSQDVIVNQRNRLPGTILDGVNWKSLGDFEITGGQLTVELSDLADGIVVADAVRIRRLP